MDPGALNMIADPTPSLQSHSQIASLLPIIIRDMTRPQWESRSRDQSRRTLILIIHKRDILMGTRPTLAGLLMVVARGQKRIQCSQLQTLEYGRVLFGEESD